MPKFDEKSENVKLPGDLFHASLKIHNQPTEEDSIHYFHFLKRGDALQTFKEFSSPSKENLAELLTVFRRKQVKPQSMATAKHKLQWLVFNPANWKLMNFLDELQILAKDAIGVAAQAIIEQFKYSKKPPHRKLSMNQAHLEKSTYELIVSHLEKELQMNGLEAPDELQINTVMLRATKPNPEKPKPTRHHCKKLGHYRNQCRQFKRETKMTPTKMVPEATIKLIITVVKQTLTSTALKPSVIAMQTVQTTEMTKSYELSTRPVRLVAKRTIPQRIASLEPRQHTDRLLGTED